MVGFNFINKSVRRQLSIPIGGVLFILLFICAYSITKTVQGSLAGLSTKYLNSSASKYGESTEKILESEFSIAKTLQAALECYEDIPLMDRRDYINNLLKHTLELNPSLIDSYCIFKANTLDGRDAEFANYDDTYDETGRLIPYWTNDGKTISCCALTEYEGSFWYEEPMKANRGILIQPNPYEVGGQMIWVCGVAFPIHNKKNEIVGMLGVDMSLDALSSMLKTAEVYQTGYLSLIAHTGLTAVTKDSALEGSECEDFVNPEYSSLFKNAAKTLQPFSFLQDEMIKVYQPLTVEGAQEVWFLGVNVNENEVFDTVSHISATVIVFFNITLIIVILLTSFKINV